VPFVFDTKCGGAAAWLTTDMAGRGWAITGYIPGSERVVHGCKAHVMPDGDLGRACRMDVEVADERIAAFTLAQNRLEVRSLDGDGLRFKLNASMSSGTYTLRLTRWYDAYVHLDELLLSLGNRFEVVCKEDGSCDHIFPGSPHTCKCADSMADQYDRGGPDSIDPWRPALFCDATWSRLQDPHRHHVCKAVDYVALEGPSLAAEQRNLRKESREQLLFHQLMAPAQAAMAFAKPILTRATAAPPKHCHDPPASEVRSCADKLEVAQEGIKPAVSQLLKDFKFYLRQAVSAIRDACICEDSRDAVAGTDDELDAVANDGLDTFPSWRRGLGTALQFLETAETELRFSKKLHPAGFRAALALFANRARENADALGHPVPALSR
jgi:hypothetical protein